MSHKPTEEEITRIREIFDRFDLDHDGEITTTELGTVLKSLGQEYSTEDLKEIIATVDADGTGTINFSEFVNLVIYQCETAKAAQDLAQAFSAFDRDGNGYISCAELKFVLKTLGRDGSDQEAREIVAEADCDGDGQISYEEFVKLITNSRG